MPKLLFTQGIVTVGNEASTEKTDILEQLNFLGILISLLEDCRKETFLHFRTQDRKRTESLIRKLLTFLRNFFTPLPSLSSLRLPGFQTRENRLEADALSIRLVQFNDVCSDLLCIHFPIISTSYTFYFF